jgi:hypothetical protein
MMITASVLVIAVFDVSAETKPSPEYLIKAAFLFNFAKFVEWPADSFKDDLSPINLYILGTDPFGPALDIIKDKTVKGRPLKIKRANKVDDIEACHILFISASEKENLKQILYALRNSSTLTVSETEGFAQMGGIINFVIINKKVHFEINLDAAQRSRLKMSSQLLKLAKIVIPDSKKEIE